MKTITGCSWLFVLFVGIAMLAMAGPASAGVGTGTLTVDNNTTLCPGASGFVDFDSPNHWDVVQGQIIHINISPSFNICTAGASNKINDRCSTNADCSTTNGQCSGPSANKTCSAGSPVNAGGSCTSNTDCNIQGTCQFGVLECDGDTTVIVKGHNGTACTSDSDCTGPGEAGCNTNIGFCKTNDVVATSGRVSKGSIDVCYTTRSDQCLTATVAYCGNVGLLSNVNHPVGSQTYTATHLRTVDATDSPIDSCQQPLISNCTNEVGSFCCGLTQGAYGAPNSVATAPGTGTCGDQTNPPNPLTGAGFLVAAACQSCNTFSGDPNATTIGIHGVRAVTIGAKTCTGGTNAWTVCTADAQCAGGTCTGGGTSATFNSDLSTLVAYLPASGSSNRFNTSGPIAPGIDTHYSNGNIGGTQNVSGSGSKGNGAGTLAGQAMACALNNFLSNCTLPFGGSGTFTASGFGNFQLPGAGTLVCTKRSGSDKVLGTGDDVCQAFAYPACVAGQTVAQVQTAANNHLANGSNNLGCTASELTAALGNFNVQFDQCGEVIDCGSQTTAGVFVCPSQGTP